MVKKGSKNEAAPSAKGRTRPRKRRSGKALSVEDRLGVALLTVTVIILTITISVAALTLRSARPRDSVPQTVSVGPPPQSGGEETGAPIPQEVPPPAETVKPPAAEAPKTVPVKPDSVRVVPPAKPDSVRAVPPVKTAPAQPDSVRVVPPVKTVPQTAPARPPAVPSPKTVPVPLGSPPPERPIRPKTLVFVIDDAGNNLRELEPFLRFPGPLTIAVLPGLPHSAEAARRIRAAGKEVLLHQPMEALGGQDPGPGAVYTGMSAGDIRAIVERNLAEIGPVAGINNHQGSKVTMNPEIMEIILALCREYRIYFLDSRTTADTAAPAAAKRMGITIGERDVFLDNIQEKAAMIRYVRDGLRQADQKGSAVMIGHTWSSELAETLEELYPELVEEGYSLSTISRFMMGKADMEEFW